MRIWRPERVGQRGAPFATNIGSRGGRHVATSVTGASRIVVHVDLDAFYASVEELDHPEYKGHPLVVGADPQGGRGRGVVTTANYLARKFGIRSAMPISEAYRRCPDARFVFPRFERYAQKSDKVFTLLKEAADAMEPASIDEAYLDLSARCETFHAAIEHCRALQRRIEEVTQLTASLGLASNKLVAKIATDMQKPKGLTVVLPGEEEAFLAPLAVRKIPGVGPKSDERLREMGIETIAQLAATAPSVLQREFGVWGPRLAQMARGIDESPVQTDWERKSVGGETTFLQDTSDPAEWRTTVAELARAAAASLVEEGTVARTVTLKVRMAGFETYTRARTLPTPTDDGEAFAHAALDLLEANPPSRAVRLLGVRLTHLVPRETRQRHIEEWDPAVLGENPPWRPRQRSLLELGE